MRRAPLLLLAPSLAGCAVQAGGGKSLAPYDAWTADVALLAEAPRENRAVFGGRFVASVGGSHEAPVQLRGAFADFGYHGEVCSGFAFEALGEIGGGRPIADRFDGFGGYVGANGAGLVRLYGKDDRSNDYHLVLSYVDLVTTVRGGAWTAPEPASAPSVFPELAADLAVRLTIGSDLFFSRVPDTR